jgi:hypothetical protein
MQFALVLYYCSRLRCCLLSWLMHINFIRYESPELDDEAGCERKSEMKLDGLAETQQKQKQSKAKQSNTAGLVILIFLIILIVIEGVLNHRSPSFAGDDIGWIDISRFVSRDFRIKFRLVRTSLALLIRRTRLRLLLLLLIVLALLGLLLLLGLVALLGLGGRRRGRGGRLGGVCRLALSNRSELADLLRLISGLALLARGGSGGGRGGGRGRHGGRRQAAAV